VTDVENTVSLSTVGEAGVRKQEMESRVVYRYLVFGRGAREVYIIRAEPMLRR
jgi:hypothetical protein